MKRQSSTRRRGFTLIELLTVITIIAMLAALGFVAMQFAINKGREKDTISLITTVSAALKSYRDDNGNYPRPANAEQTTVVKEETWVVGGAAMLYQVLSGDGTTAIRNGEKLPTGEQASAKDDKIPFSGKIYMDSIIAPTKKQREEKKQAKNVEADGEESFYVCDPWRHPLRYQVPDRDRNGVVTDDIKMHSDSDFELWSYGELKKPEDTDEAQLKWIGNWGR